MSKAITLDLFSQLEAVTGSVVALDDGMSRASASVRMDQVRIAMLRAEKIVIRSGRVMLKIANVTERIDAVKSALKNCHRKAAQKAVLRTYPKFTPGMSTALYIAKFAAANGVSANVLPFDLSQYTDSCALYENGAVDFDVIEEQIEEMPPVSPPVAEIPEAAEPWADVLTSSVESIGALNDGEFSRMVEAFAEINYHSEALMMRCLRAGRVDLAAAVAHLVRFQNSDDYQGLDGFQCEARAAVSAMLAGESTDNISHEAAAILESCGLVMRKPQASPAFVALMAQAREAKRITMEAIKKARVSSAQAPAQEDGSPYPYLQPLADNRGGGVAAAKSIRHVLKNEFPGVKFRVRSDYSSVNVYWTDGPTARAVDGALAPFDIGHSDCQTDYFYTEKTRFSDTFGGVQYLFTHRELSPDAIKASIAAVFGDNGPTYEEWKNGTPWPSVANKGAWHDSTMCDHYEWLAMVRRHANGTD